MFNLKSQPYHLLLLAAVIMLIASVFAANDTVDIHLQDTYYVVALSHLLWVIIGLLLSLWMLNLVFRKILFSKRLTWAHVILTIAGSLLLVAISFFSTRYYGGFAGMPRRYYDKFTWETLLQYNNLTKASWIAILMAGIGILVFVTHLVVGLVKRISRPSSIPE